MSTSNIIDKKWNDFGQLAVTFSVNPGDDTRTYWYSGAAASAIFAGADPPRYQADKDDGGGQGGRGTRAQKRFDRAKSALDKASEEAGGDVRQLEEALSTFETAVAEIGELGGALL